MGLRSSCAQLALLVVGVAACNDEMPTHEVARGLRVEAPLILWDTDRLVRWDPGLTPLSIRAVPRGFAVIDRSEQQLVLLDSTLRESARVGRPGSGPGELSGAMRLESWNHGIVVGEGANGRFSMFDHDGHFVRVARRSYLGTPFGVDTSGGITTPVQVLPRLIDQGPYDAARPVRTGTRPAVTDNADARHTGRDLVVFRPNGSTVLVENRSGVLLQLDDDGRVTTRWTFPEPLIELLRAQRRARVALFEARTGSRVFAAPLIKDAAARGNSLLLAFNAAPDCLALVDLDQAEFRIVRAADSTLNAALCRAESVALSSAFLAVATDDSLIRFTLPQPRRFD